jgi:hypothetical protein
MDCRVKPGNDNKKGRAEMDASLRCLGRGGQVHAALTRLVPPASSAVALMPPRIFFWKSQPAGEGTPSEPHALSDTLNEDSGDSYDKDSLRETAYRHRLDCLLRLARAVSALQQDRTAGMSRRLPHVLRRVWA